MYQIHEDVYCLTVASLWEGGDDKGGTCRTDN